MENPKIRFKGFTKDWEQRKLADVCSRVQGNDGRMKLPTLTISAGNGWMRQEDRFSGNIAGKEQKNYTLLHTGELSYNHGNSKSAKYGAVFSLRNYEEALVPRVYHSFRVEEGSADYIEYYFATKLPDRELRKLISSGARMDGLLNIGYDEFMGIKMMFPSIKEQNEIAAYFRSLDHLITLHQRKCDQTKNLKKYMLRKMFPQNGAKVPEIRFDGHTYDWEQRKFGEITELKSASRVHKDEWTSNGVPFYRSSDVMTAINGTENEKAFISEELYEKLSKVSGKLEEGDILVTGGGSVGNPYIVPDNKPLYTKDADLLWIKNKGKFHPYFLYEFFFSPTFRNYLGSISHVGTIAHYTITQLSDTPISLPSFEEQKEVGEYFQSLDHLITLHQRKCDELKKMKKYMLQNMFI